MTTMKYMNENARTSSISLKRCTFCILDGILSYVSYPASYAYSKGLMLRKRFIERPKATRILKLHRELSNLTETLLHVNMVTDSVIND